jgi:hypothetical protein
VFRPGYLAAKAQTEASAKQAEKMTGIVRAAERSKRFPKGKLPEEAADVNQEIAERKRVRNRDCRVLDCWIKYAVCIRRTIWRCARM